MTLSELRSISYPESKRRTNEYMLATFICRKVSIYFTYLFIRLGLTANQVSLLAIAASLAGCYLLGTGQHSSTVLWGALLINLAFLFDCIDGEIARYKGSTFLGLLLEITYSEVTYAILLPSIAIGLYIDSASPRAWLVVLAFLGSISKLLFDSFLKSLAHRWSLQPAALDAFHSPWGKVLVYQFWASQQEAHGVGRFLFLLRQNLFEMNGILLPLVIVAVLLNRLEVYVISYSVAYILLYLGTLFLGMILLSIKKFDQARK